MATKTYYECSSYTELTNEIKQRFRDPYRIERSSGRYPTERFEPKMVPVMFNENTLYGIHPDNYKKLDIKNVIFNEPATIVFWTDGTKTVVKAAEGDEFDPEKGIAMAISKKIFGNQGSYYNKIKKWTKPYYEEEYKLTTEIRDSIDVLFEIVKKIKRSKKEDE